MNDEHLIRVVINNDYAFRIGKVVTTSYLKVLDSFDIMCGDYLVILDDEENVLKKERVIK